LLVLRISYSISVQKILEDNVKIKDSIIIHGLIAYKNINNVSINDHYSEYIEIDRYDLVNSNFLVEDTFLLEIAIGDLKEGETKTINYTVKKGKATALLGATTYFIEGEKHQLYPKEVEINISDNFFLKLFSFIENIFKIKQGG